MDPNRFFDHIWAGRPLHLRGRPVRFAGLFDRRRFDLALSRAAAASDPRNFQVRTVVEDGHGSYTCTEPIAPEEVEDVLAGGSTICVRDIGVGDDRLAAFGDAVRRAAHFTGSISFNAYLSPDRSGADFHFDRCIATTLQIEGRKRWRYAPHPSVAWPPANARLPRGGDPEWTLPWIGNRGWDELPPVAPRDFIEVILEPGDVLCLPAGTWHAAKAVGGSLALNMSLSAQDGSSFFAILLKQIFEGDPAWRSGPPPTGPAQRPPGDGLPEAVRDYFEARIGDLRDRLDGLNGDDPLVVGLWRGLVANDGFRWSDGRIE
ncbi:MAG: hypothetical protein QOK17_471 [Sphingomonadales bacterium]|nr:hypothetical protein [Sphingomonadales bacterium]